MKYAVFAIKGSQYKASEGEELHVQGLEVGNESLVLDKVLLIVDGDKISIGNPYVEGASVEVKVLGEEKGDKVRILKFRAKSRYRKRMGFRPKYIRIRVEKINSK